MQAFAPSVGAFNRPVLASSMRSISSMPLVSARSPQVRSASCFPWVSPGLSPCCLRFVSELLESCVGVVDTRAHIVMTEGAREQCGDRHPHGVSCASPNPLCNFAASLLVNFPRASSLRYLARSILMLSRKVDLVAEVHLMPRSFPPTII